jgi:hypothetical protein
MSYIDKLRLFGTSQFHRRGRRFIVALALTHIVANFFVVSRGRSLGTYATIEDARGAALYWCVFTLVWWTFVYMGWRLAMLLTRHDRSNEDHNDLTEDDR